jgi:hypothetical protein
MSDMPPWLYVTPSGSLRLDLREYLQSDQARRQIAYVQVLERHIRRRRLLKCPHKEASRRGELHTMGRLTYALSQGPAGSADWWPPVGAPLLGLVIKARRDHVCITR